MATCTSETFWGQLHQLTPQLLSIQQIALDMLSECGESKEDALSLLLGGMTLWSAIIIQNFEMTDGPILKNSQKWHSSVPADSIALPTLFWMSFPPRRKSLAIGLVILFHLFELPLSMWRGGWEKIKQVERGRGRGCHDHQWREELHARESELALAACARVCAY